MDLRERVVAAVERDGLSRNQAAARFGIAVSTAVHWLRRYHTRGDVKPSKIGGYRKDVRDTRGVADRSLPERSSPSASWWSSSWRWFPR
jgi:transposase